MLDKLKAIFKNNGAAENEAAQLAAALSDNSNEMFGLPEDYSPSKEKKEYPPALRERLDKLLTAINNEVPPKPCVRLKSVRSECSVFDSKLGGTPYFPKNMEYPTAREGELQGRPLRLLAQLNFGALPHIEGFPEKGILQFYAGCADDDMVGADFKDGQNQNTFRVIYHADIITDESQLIGVADLPEYDDEEQFWAFPFEGEFLLQPSAAAACVVSNSDYRFEKAAVKGCKQLLGIELSELYDLTDTDEDLYDALYEVFGGGVGAKIGGFPYFTQEDIRGCCEEYAACDVLLFQLDSEGDGEDEIMWGDCGVGNFFISADDLRRLDFSRVLYTWDCC